ncbi:hypothetical protein GF312_15940 [Candidatus Poribacteria bacterium]|nr:hypothetical protein [Candidatus Poribacteria bacterium]
MWKSILSVSLVITIIWVNYSWSADEDNVTAYDLSEPLSLEDCINIALQQSSNIKNSELDLESAKLDIQDAFSNYLPQVDINGEYRFTDMIDFGWEEQNYNASLGASYIIWDHGRREAEIAQSRASERSVESSYKETKQDLIFNITQAYYNVLEAERLIDVNEDLLEISKSNVKKTKAFEETGRSIPADVAAARVQQANDELSLINAQHNFELARAQLASIMGLDPDSRLKIVDEEEISSPLLGDNLDNSIYMKTVDPTLKMSLENSILTASENRPEIISTKSRITSLEWSLRIARMERWPVLTAECNFNVDLDDYLRDTDNFSNYRDWSAVARLTFPIFDNGINKRRERNAEIRIQKAQQDFEELGRSIALDVQQAYLDLVRARKSMEIASEQVVDATNSMNVTQGRYERNMIIFLELLSAQARYAQALVNQVRAFYDYKIAEKALKKAMGILGVEG